MTFNREAVDRFEQAYNAKIEKLYWLAGSLDNHDLRSIIEDDMSEKDFKKCFPKIFNSEYYKEYLDDNEILQAFVDFNYFGLFAEVYVPKASDFTFKNGKPVSWSSNGGISRIAYVYAETMEELLKEIELSAKEIFDDCIQSEKKKKVKV
jgi:hypothetical protein